jgi:23S rRNA (cytosine1962-C5)-methyltransferase
VTNDALRQIRGGHPWVFDHSITSVSHQGAPGDLAVVFDDRRRFVAIGLWDPASPIRLKVLHAGSPATIDATWWRAKLSAARERRNPLVATDTDGYRWVNGENDGLPGVVLDRYADHVVLKVYSSALFPHLDHLVGAIDDLTHPRSLVLRMARSVAADRPARQSGFNEGDALLGTAPTEPVMFRELGLWFEADVIRGQKTGHFLDQRDNRARVAARCTGADVLDVFAATGGFTVHAAAAGARSVTAIDSSAPTLAAAQRNLSHNLDRPEVARCRFEPIVADAEDAMQSLVAAGRRFDMVIVDPPSFAKRHSDIEPALRAYRRLASLAARLSKPGGRILLASCSSRVDEPTFVATVRAAVQRAGYDLHSIQVTGHAVDHPVTFSQGRYLKAVHADVVAGSPLAANEP